MTIYYASNIPALTRETLDAWASDARPVGGFVQAVLENDLREAFARADYDNTLAMPAIVSYIYNDLPALCWGSKENFAAWPAMVREMKKLGTDTVKP